MSDVLGVMRTWADGVTVVERDSPAGGGLAADGPELVRIDIADIVSGKPVPPRPSPRLRVGADEAELRSLADWPPLETERLGGWLLRASGGFSARGNSALVAGDPGLPLAEALDRVVGFYARRDLPAWSQVVVGSPEADAFAAAGWTTARAGEADTCFQMASVAQASRAVRRSLRGSPAGDGVDCTLSDRLPQSWLSHDERLRAYVDVARPVLEGPEQVGFLTVREAPDEVVAAGRVSTDGDWAGITDVWVAPARRRQGLALLVMRELLEWSAERGATTAYLSVLGDNTGALALYDRLGFVTHHQRRYLAAPS
jgi:ribosomal protein S18 acetylase RimI-like enzyme